MATHTQPEAILLLEDGTVFRGRAFGHIGEAAAEVVFNTAMTGYQEILTDPSYRGQIVTMTYPLIGNYGVNKEDVESRAVFLSGFVVKERSQVYSNFRADADLDQYLKCWRVVGIEGIDTRKLTRRLRVEGAMKGIISATDLDIDSLKKKLEAAPGLVGRDLVREVTREEHRVVNPEGETRFRVAALDYGMKENIVRSLTKRGCQVTIFPAHTSAREILMMNPDGIFLSNGPGDPAAVDYAVETVRKVLGQKPLFGICLGHQLLALAAGAPTYKLKFGHHGANHPVKNLKTEAIEITSQNHGFTVDIEKLPEKFEMTHINLNDQTVEGIASEELKAFSVQYHPEAAPGPHESAYLFDDFITLMEKNKSNA